MKVVWIIFASNPIRIRIMRIWRRVFISMRVWIIRITMTFYLYKIF
jgi:hypothetical protein